MAWFGAVRLVDYEPDRRIKPHAHREASLSLIVGGRYSEQIRGRDEVHETGHMLYCPANKEHAQAFAPHGRTAGADKGWAARSVCRRTPRCPKTPLHR